MGEDPKEPKEIIRVVCLPVEMGPAYFDDDKYGECCECGKKIRWRPHNPEPSEKICFPCWMDDENKSAMPVVTERTLEDLEKIIAMKKEEFNKNNKS